jgi:hypothetical protein
MSLINEFLKELQTARDFEHDRISGYQEISGIPHHLFSEEAIKEITEAYTWSNNRIILIQHAITAVEFLLWDDYPNRIQQIVSDKVLKDLQQLLEYFRIAVEELESSPKATLIVGPEVKI